MLSLLCNDEIERCGCNYINENLYLLNYQTFYHQPKTFPFILYTLAYMMNTSIYFKALKGGGADFEVKLISKMTQGLNGFKSHSL